MDFFRKKWLICDSGEYPVFVNMYLSTLTEVWSKIFKYLWHTEICFDFLSLEITYKQVEWMYLIHRWIKSTLNLEVYNIQMDFKWCLFDLEKWRCKLIYQEKYSWKVVYRGPHTDS